MNPIVDRDEPELLVVLPEELKEFYEASGYVAPSATEDRFSSRLRVRRRASIEFIDTPPALRDVVECRQCRSAILVKDLSRTGIAFLFHTHVYPSEEATVFLQGRILDLVIKRCRRVGPNCYEVGAAVTHVTADDTPA